MSKYQGELMIYGLTVKRHEEVDQEFSQMEAFLLELRQEIHDTTAPGSRYNYLWLQADSTISYVRSLRAALQQGSIGHN
jgi:hypothetical protein